jgi:hypothetical protein
MGEPALLYCFIFLYLAAAGPGPWEREQLAGPGLLHKNVGAPSRRRTIKFEFHLDIVRSLGQSSETL